ncbi:MAG: hypothetical protein JNK73_05895 [Bacteroidia bacterium]|nr:hypothetical protein [Bacteroidia bacterium]
MVYLSASIMRDFIWTLIIIWTIYQLSALFRNRKKTGPARTAPPPSDSYNAAEEQAKTRLRKASDREGEYVDFEELK